MFGDTTLATSSVDILSLVAYALGVVIAVGTIAYALLRRLASNAIDAAKTKALVDANVLEKVQTLTDTVEQMCKDQKPNGLDTQTIGDIAKRTENKVLEVVDQLTSLADDLKAHVAVAAEKERNMWRAINAKADK